MNIKIVALGTRGDLQPFIAIAKALQDTEHAVTLISAKNEAQLVASYGIHFHPLNVNIQEMMQTDDVKTMLKGNNPVRFIIGHLQAAKKLNHLMCDIQSEIWDACLGADIIIYHPGMPIGFFIAQHLGITAILVSPFPIVPTNNYPSILFYSLLKFGTYYNKITHYIFQKIFWGMTKQAVKKYWMLQVKSKQNFSTPAIIQHINSGMSVINAYSNYLFPHSADWKKNIHTTGGLFLKEQDNFIPPVHLETFIKAGQAPIYIGFGSMKKDATFRDTLSVIIAALKSTNQRAIIALGWTNADLSISLPNTILFIDSIPHAWLFPQMSLIIHHGGAGTTAASLAAGKPTVVIPHNADQPAWGRKVYELGVGPMPIPSKKLTAKRLAKAINFALQPHIISAAKALGEKMTAEKGVEKLVTILNNKTLSSK